MILIAQILAASLVALIRFYALATLGHAWLQVRVDGEVRDVDPGSPANRPGVVQFVRLTPWSDMRRSFERSHT